MSISSTIGGVVKEITAPSATVGGVVHELESVHTVSGGVLKELFKKDASGGLPTALTWEIDPTVTDGVSECEIHSISNDGFTVEFSQLHSTRDGYTNPRIHSQIIYIPAGTTVILRNDHCSGAANREKLELYIRPVTGGEEITLAITTKLESTGETVEKVVETAGKYVLWLNARSYSSNTPLIGYNVYTTATIIFQTA